MNAITKKRMKAYFIDLAIYTAALGVTEYVLRKKVKSEAVHALVTPSIVYCTLESIQLYRSGQTIGYKKMGLLLESTTGHPLTNTQILKRIFYRDTISGVKYVLNRPSFDTSNGQQLPHDVYAKTVVKEVQRFDR